jgi:hypothetical protein
MPLVLTDSTHYREKSNTFGEKCSIAYLGGSDMKKLFVVFTIAMLLLSMVGCAAGPNAFVDSPDEDGDVAGFWQGLWHGIISPFAFLISLFSDTIHIYEIHNNGGWYNFGFLLGASMIFGGSGGGAARRRRRRDKR